MAKFWDWQSSSTPDTRGATAVAAPSLALEMVEIYTFYALVLGEVDSAGRRLSDILNSSSHLAVRNARSISLVNGVGGSEGKGWTRVGTEDILFAMPPEHVSPRQMRIHRRKHRIRIETGPYVVTGNAHVLPGIRLDPYVLRSRMRFLAMTDVHVSSTTDPVWERNARVVLVNVKPLKDLTEVLTIS